MCEGSLRVLETIHLILLFRMDCNAALAMTSPSGHAKRSSNVASSLANGIDRF